MRFLQPTILIVDDEKHTRDGLRRLLEDEYDTYVAEDIRGAMDVLERDQIDVLHHRSAPRRRRRNDVDRARAETAAPADLHHDDGLRLGRHRGRSDETRRLRFRDQAAQSRQGRNADRARARQPPDGAGKSHAAPAGGRALRPREHHRRIAGACAKCSTRSGRSRPRRRTS